MHDLYQIEGEIYQELITETKLPVHIFFINLLFEAGKSDRKTTCEIFPVLP